MASVTVDPDSALRASVFCALQARTQNLESALAVAGAITATLAIVHRTIADFASVSNLTRRHVLWGTLPAEIQLQTVHWMPPAQRATMLGVSRRIRQLLLSDTSLWTTISHPRNLGSESARVEFLQTVIARSGSRPLDLAWNEATVRDWEGPDPVYDIIHSLRPRVRTLSLDQSYFLLGPNPFWTAATPLLETLTITTRPSSLLNTVISKALWKGSNAPLLRILRLAGCCFDGLPDEPLSSVVHLEAHTGVNLSGRGWDRIWAWLPRLETLVVHLTHNDPPSIPSPPETLRHVTLRISQDCVLQPHFLSQWTTHNVRVLEISSAAENTLCWAVDFLARCEPASLWGAVFAIPRDWRSCEKVVALHGQSLTVVIQPETLEDLAGQIRLERGRTVLADRMQTLDLGCRMGLPMALSGITLLRLRSVTISWADEEMLPGFELLAPGLEQITFDLTSSEDAVTKLGLLPLFAGGITYSRLLRDITIRLPLAFNRHSPVLAKVSERLRPAAREVWVDYISAEGGTYRAFGTRLRMITKTR